MSSPIDQIRRHLAELEADAILLSFLPDVRWACGFTGSNGFLLLRDDDAVFLTDGRYEVQAAQEVRGARVMMGGYDLLKFAAEQHLLDGCSAVVYQADHVPVVTLEKLQELFGDVSWIGSSDLLVHEVASKREDEIDRIREAQRLTERVFDEVLVLIREGMRESELAAEIVYRHLRYGAERMSFDPIVASGPNSALPHGRPTDRRLRQGDVVLLDFGCFLDGYASDMTRTVALGQPDSEVRSVYNLVLAAQEQAIASAKSGVTSKNLDAVARQVIKEGGYGERFSHGLGHGLGLQIHEWPRVSYTVDYPLPDNCAVTIEPGVYLPERFGVRIEDIVVLRSGGCENLTHAPKELIVL